MLYATFGQKVDAWEALGKLLERAAKSVRKLSGYEATVLLREHYIDTFKLEDLDTTDHPWALVADHNRDGLRDLWGMEKRLMEFELYEIHSKYGYDFTQFISLPRHLVEFILNGRRDEERKLRVAREKAERDAAKKFENDSNIPITPGFLRGMS